MIGISLNFVADDRGSSLRLVVAVVVIGTSLSTVGTELGAKDNVLEGTGEETSFRGMLEGSTGMDATSFFEVSSPNRDSENFLRKNAIVIYKKYIKKRVLLRKKGQPAYTVWKKSVKPSICI